MTTASQVQQAFAATNRGQSLDTTLASAIAAQIDNSAGAFTLKAYTSQQFEANQNTTGLALEIFSAIVGKTEATAADLTTVTNIQKGLLAAYGGLSSPAAVQAASDDLGAQLSDNATGLTFRSLNILASLYDTQTPSTAFFDINGFVANQLTNVFGSAAATSTAIAFEAQRFAELANRYKSFADSHDATGYVRAAGALVAELISQGEQANNGLYHSAALNFIQADAAGNANYGANLLSFNDTIPAPTPAGGGSASGNAPSGNGVQGNIFALSTGADVVPTAALSNANDDLINAFTTANSLTGVDNINGGGGFDIMAASYSGAIALQSNIQNVEELLFKNTSAGLVAIDTSTIQGAQSLWDFGSTGTGGITFSNLASSNGVVTPVIGLGGGTASDTLTVTLAGGVTNATLNVQLDNANRLGAGFDTLVTTGVKTMNLNLAPVSGISLLSDPDTMLAQGQFTGAAGTNNNNVTLSGVDFALTTVFIRGAGYLNLSETFQVSQSLALLDASGLAPSGSNKGLTFDFSGNYKSGLVVIGSSGVDTLTAGVSTPETVQGNGGADSINLGFSINDRAVVKYAQASDSTLTAMDTINAFYSGADKLDVGALGFTAAAGANQVTKLATVAGLGPTGADFSGFFSQPAVGSQAVFDTTTKVLYLDSNHDGSFNVVSDTVIKFTSLANGDLKFSDFIFS